MELKKCTWSCDLLWIVALDTRRRFTGLDLPITRKLRVISPAQANFVVDENSGDQ